MVQSVRQYWGPHKGRRVFNFNWGAISAGSVVIVTASEYDHSKPGEHFTKSDWPRFVGAANIWVSDVAPHSNPGGVGFVVNVDWGEPLPVVTDITVLDPPVDIEEQTF